MLLEYCSFPRSNTTSFSMLRVARFPAANLLRHIHDLRINLVLNAAEENRAGSGLPTDDGGDSAGLGASVAARCDAVVAESQGEVRETCLRESSRRKRKASE